MIYLKRIINCGLILALCNCVFWWNLPWGGILPKIILTLLLIAFFLFRNIVPLKTEALPKKTTSLAKGCELLLTGAICWAAQVLVCLYWALFSPIRFHWAVWVGGIALMLLVLFILFLNASLRLFFSSAQFTLAQRLCLIFLWWAPLINLFIFYRLYIVACAEYRMLRTRFLRNRQRAPLQVCATRYPLLMVHGIFFRDWKAFNYWGRIPAELEENGARIFYGQQQSSASVESSAEELRARILQIIQEPGCEKVNIIAHSKGGLNSRYAISCLGMDKYVASLTTVNTPALPARRSRACPKALSAPFPKITTSCSPNWGTARWTFSAA